MGRIFEVRKHAMFARWNRMAKQFARIGKEITIAVKKGGPDPDSNPALRRCIQNARAVNMPKDKIESAIKRASGRDAANFEEVLYEGYAPHGVAVLVECATDNPTRTVASVTSRGALDGGLNLVLRHVHGAGVLDAAPQRRIRRRVRPARLYRDGDFLADPGELLRHPVPAREHRVLADFENASHETRPALRGRAIYLNGAQRAKPTRLRIITTGQTKRL